MSEFRIRLGTLLVLSGTLIAMIVPLSAQEAEKKPSHIFDFGGFDDAPASQPTVRERARPSRTPVPAVVTPTPTPPPIPAPIPEVTPPASPVGPPSVPATPALLPVPIATEASKAIAIVNKTFAAELAGAQDRMSKRNLALRLTAASTAADVTPSEQYAAVMVALQLAVTSGDAPVAVRTADSIVQRFAVDELSLRSTMILDMAPKAILANDAYALATAAIPLIEAATREDDFDTAEKLAQAGEQCAVRAATRDSVLLGRIRMIAGDMRAAKTQYAAAKPALDAIAAGAGTPAHRTLAGKYICFTKGNWSRGLPLLTDCDDPKLKSAALRDLSLPAAAPDRMVLADAWWMIAGAEGPETRAGVMDRAAYWYRELLPHLQEQDRTTPQVRISQAVAATRKLEPGLIAEIFHDPGLGMRQRIRIDPTVGGDFSTKLPDPNVDRDIFGIRWTGMIKAPKTGTYTFVVKVKESIRIWIDGMLVLKADNPTNKATVDVLMVEGLHDIRIHYNSRGNKSMVRFAWTSTGLFTDQEVGAQYLFHDVRAGGEYLAGGSLMPDAYDRTQRMGGHGGGFYDDITPDHLGTLAGFHVTGGKAGQYNVVKSIAPIFQDSIGQKRNGKTFGRVSAEVQTVVAKPGYAVASVTARGGGLLNCFKVGFARLMPNGTLNLSDSYESDWVGGSGGGNESLYGGDGRLVVGICGRCGDNVESMGLILRGKPAANAMAIVSARWGGPGGKWADVTARLRNMLRDSKPLQATHTDLASDPTPGKRKKLEITYTDQGVKKTITFEEGQTIAIPGLISR